MFSLALIAFLAVAGPMNRGLFLGLFMIAIAVDLL